MFEMNVSLCETLVDALEFCAKVPLVFRMALAVLTHKVPSQGSLHAFSSLCCCFMLFCLSGNIPLFWVITHSAVHRLSACASHESANIYFRNVDKVKAKANSFCCPPLKSQENTALFPVLKEDPRLFFLKNKCSDRCLFPPALKAPPNANI